MFNLKVELSDDVLDPDFLLPIGKAKIMREGTDVTLVAHSKPVGFCLDAAEILATQGINAEVINLRSIRPLDTDTVIESVKKTGRLVTVENGWPLFGVGAEICAQIAESSAFDFLDAPVQRVTGADVPTPYAKNLEDKAFPSVDDIVTAVHTAAARTLPLAAGN